MLPVPSFLFQQSWEYNVVQLKGRHTQKAVVLKGWFTILSDPGVPGVRSMGPDVSPSLTPRGFADLTDVTLADEDSNSIPTDDVNGQSQAMWQCKWRHLVANIETNTS